MVGEFRIRGRGEETEKGRRGYVGGREGGGGGQRS